MADITIERVREILQREEKQYIDNRPRSQALHAQACKNFVGGVPMTWMRIWAGAFPIFVDHAEGVYLTDVDGHEYLDLCLGDTGALAGHANPHVVTALNEQAAKGTTHMLPTADSIWVGQELERRFGLPYWHIVMTATDANRMALKAAREFTGRRKILAFNGSYHGSVDETLCVQFGDIMLHAPGAIGPMVDHPSITTRMVEFNDVAALEKALKIGDIACVITEPVMTNIGIIFPEPGFHDELRRLTRKYGALLLIDETHCLCAGPAGITGEMNLDPDIIVFGKPVAGGYPAGVMGFTREIGDMLNKRVPWHLFFGFGGTLSGNAGALAGMKATLEKVLNRENFARMIPLAEHMEAGIAQIIKDNDLPWYVARVGCRVEFRFLAAPPKNATDTLADVPYNEVDIFTEGLTGPLEELIHIYCANRGILLTPVHEMALVGPATTREDVDRYVDAIRSLVEELVQ